MSAENTKNEGFKEKALHEGEEFLGIFAYLAFFFCAIAAYSRLILNEYHISFFAYGTALINALVIGKVILIGEYFQLGKRHESKPLYLAAFYKALVFSLLVFGFHVLEEAIKLLIHGETFASALRNIRIDVLLSRSLVVFCTFVPLFAFREMKRVIGEDEFRALFFRPRAAVKPAVGD